MRILVVEDDQLLNKTLSYNLSAVGYSVDGAMSKAVAIRFLEKQDYDLIVLDVNLPDGNGFDFCREVKERRPDTAVIFLTANDMESDMLKGYELGAEDYVTKPFPMSVFQKKLSVVLGRLAKQSGGGDSYEDGALSINFSEMTASLSGKALVFTPLEYRLLKILTKNPQNVLTRQVLLEKLWDADGNFVDEHALTAAISRVRIKLKQRDASTSRQCTAWAICGSEGRRNEYAKTLHQQSLRPFGNAFAAGGWCSLRRCVSADPEYNRCPVCVPVQSLCTALRYLLCGPDPPEAGPVLRCLLWSDG